MVENISAPTSREFDYNHILTDIWPCQTFCYSCDTENLSKQNSKLKNVTYLHEGKKRGKRKWISMLIRLRTFFRIY